MADLPTPKDLETARDIANEITHEWSWCFEKPDTNCLACRMTLRIAAALVAQREADAVAVATFEMPGPPFITRAERVVLTSAAAALRGRHA